MKWNCSVSSTKTEWNTMSDESLCVIAHSNERACEVLFERYTSPVECYLRSRFNGIDYEEIASEAIWKTISSAYSRNVGNFRAYVYTVARRLGARANSQLTKLERLIADTIQILHSNDAAFEGQIPERSVIAHLSERAQVDCIFRAVASLSKADRVIFILYYVDQLSVSDIMEQLGSTESAVKNRLLRARRQIQQNSEIRRFCTASDVGDEA
jgi:RNA polymerase sigma factor (sigma-70 family)